MAHPYDAVIPLFLANDPDDVCLVGSGVLVLLEAEYFLLTAAHVTDHLDGHHLIFTVTVQASGIVRSGGAYKSLSNVNA